MIDLVCLVADKNIQASIEAILGRHEALGVRAIQFETIVHPHRGPGCFHRAAELLKGYRDRAGHAIVVLDRAWGGAPANTGVELEHQLESSLRSAGLVDWACAVVIDPELEVWVFSNSPHVENLLGWQGESGRLRQALSDQSLWPAGLPKPPDPKAAVEWALWRARKPRSSSIYRELAGRVSFDGCQDRSFLRLRDLLFGWFSSRSAGA